MLAGNLCWAALHTYRGLCIDAFWGNDLKIQWSGRQTVARAVVNLPWKNNVFVYLLLQTSRSQSCYV